MTGFKLVEAGNVPKNGPEELSPSWERGHGGQARGDAVWAVPAPIGPGDPSKLSGATITVVDDGQRVALLVAVLLESHGAKANVVEPDGIPVASDGIIHLGQLHATTQVAVDLFEDVYPVAMAGATTVLAVTGLGGMYGGGLAESAADKADRTGITGLFGALAEELPGANVRAVGVDCFDDPVVIAGRIVAEASAAGGPVAVGYRDDRRCALVTTDPTTAIDDLDQRVGWGA
jgi:hypothetical protein